LIFLNGGRRTSGKTDDIIKNKSSRNSISITEKRLP